MMGSPSNPATRPNQIWQLEVGILDVFEDPFFLVIAIDIYTRLVPAFTVTRSSLGDTAATLNDVCARSGYPEQLWIDRGFSFTSAALKEWGAQHNVAVFYGPPFVN